jgi:hypothetical protein
VGAQLGAPGVVLATNEGRLLVEDDLLQDERTGADDAIVAPLVRRLVESRSRDDAEFG